MLVEITYSCKMGCTHCMSDCKPNGENMSIEVFKDTLNFMIKHNIPTWSFSGGEMFEHPQILEMIDILEEKWKEVNHKYPIVFITNGRELVRNKDIYKAISNFKKRHNKNLVLIQVTDDDRFYPDPLSDKEKYWLKKLGATVEKVPSHPLDKEKCLYPQGRALENFPDANWNTIGPKCANCILIAKQGIDTFNGLVITLLSKGKVCTPVIAPDGSIKLGESALCPKVSSIYDSETEIMNKIKNHNCHSCKIPWEKLKETNPIAYQILTK